ncbi:MAG: hypothetical protein M3Q07_04355, partial [Pseudobdellovibrionaceae bacterium]|nr:hypothetical protein [Pseudobdellovibrionaceae bacterium]
VGPCIYGILSKDGPGLMKYERIAQRAPCRDELAITKSLDRVFTNESGATLSTLLIGNLKNFSKPIPYPVKTA